MDPPPLAEHFRYVLGIDAAWTAGNPSGVTLIGERAGRWRLLAVAGSFAEFNSLAGSASGAVDDVPSAAAQLAGRPPDLVAIDMPLSTDPIERRRPADDAVSRLWGARKCGTHTPNADRPGAVGVRLHEAFGTAGYTLATGWLSERSLIEVYPHPAVVELVRAAERVPYKAAKTRAYWPGLPAADRRTRLFEVWRSIVDALDAQIEGVGAALPLPSGEARGAALKRFEDQLDAVICAWVGALALDGRAVPHGDARAAIWLPQAGLCN